MSSHQFKLKLDFNVLNNVLSMNFIELYSFLGFIISKSLQEQKDLFKNNSFFKSDSQKNISLILNDRDPIIIKNIDPILEKISTDNLDELTDLLMDKINQDSDVVTNLIDKVLHLATLKAKNNFSIIINNLENTQKRHNYIAFITVAVAKENEDRLLLYFTINDENAFLCQKFMTTTKKYFNSYMKNEF